MKDRILIFLILFCFIFCFFWFQFSKIKDVIIHPRTGYQNIIMAHNLRFNRTLSHHLGKFVSSEIKEKDISSWDVLVQTLVGEKKDFMSNHLKSFRTKKFLRKVKGYRNRADLSDYLKRSMVKILNQATDDLYFFLKNRDQIKLKEGAESYKWFNRLLKEKILIISDDELSLKDSLHYYDKEKIRWFNIAILKEQYSPSFLKKKAKPRPTNLREPLYPAFLALGMLLNPSLKESFMTDLYLIDKEREKNVVLARKLRLNKYLQIFVLFLTSMIGMWVALKLTKNFIIAVICLFMIGFSPRLTLGNNILLAENFSAFILILLSFSLLIVFKSPRKKSFILFGVLLALMTLTRAIYQYYWFLALLILAYLIWKVSLKRKTILIGAGLFFILYFFITGAWIVRNYYYLEVPSITYRGGLTLLYRSNLNMMHSREYFATFFRYIPKMYGINAEIIGKKILGEEAFNRFPKSNPEGFIMQTIIHQKGIEQDKLLEKQALKRIISHPFRHLLLSIPFGFRVMFTELGIWSPILFMAFFGGIFFWLRKRRWNMLIFCSPALYNFVMHAFLTDGLPRYYIPMIPVVIVATLCFLYEIMGKTFVKLKWSKNG